MDSGAPHSARPYPVSITLQVPARFERVQLLLRLGVCVTLGAFGTSLAGLYGLLYVLLPVMAAILISSRPSGSFPAHDAGWFSPLLEWVVGLVAYLYFLSDRFPLGTEARSVRLHVQPQGTPSVGQALARCLTSLPHAAVLCLLGLVAGVVGVLAAISIAFTEHYPLGLQRVQRDIVAWGARVLAYHACLVDTYPPFSFLGDRPALPPDAQPERA